VRRGNFTVFRCPSILHGRAPERLSSHVSGYVLFAFVRSKSLVSVGFGVSFDSVGEFDFRAQNITKLCSETHPFFEFANTISFVVNLRSEQVDIKMLIEQLYRIGLGNNTMCEPSWPSPILMILVTYERKGVC
jgi:hypothetical protein